MKSGCADLVHPSYREKLYHYTNTHNLLSSLSLQTQSPRRSAKIVGKRFSMGEELCGLDDVRMRACFTPYWKVFSLNLALLCPPIADSNFFNKVPCQKYKYYHLHTKVTNKTNKHSPFKYISNITEYIGEILPLWASWLNITQKIEIENFGKLHALYYNGLKR